MVLEVGMVSSSTVLNSNNYAKVLMQISHTFGGVCIGWSIKGKTHLPFTTNCEIWQQD